MAKESEYCLQLYSENITSWEYNLWGCLHSYFKIPEIMGKKVRDRSKIKQKLI